MWGPALVALEQRDPGRQVLVLDLPGHGGSPDQPSYDLEDVAGAVEQAVEDAGLRPPVIVGHSIAGIIATGYATRYATCGVVNVDQSLDTAFLNMLHASREALAGPAFPVIWASMLASMKMEVLPETARHLLSTSTPRQDVVLGYWRQALDRPEEEIETAIDAMADALRHAQLPYTIIAGHGYGTDYNAWLQRKLPQATVTAYPDSGHFPHLAHPDRFAECLASTATWMPLEGRPSLPVAPEDMR
jgi:pimeloyl-ACP methyl ester carboxylesterase